MQLRKISIAPNVALESLSLINVRLSTVEMAELNQQQTTARATKNVFSKKAIRHLYISHNTLCLPPKILHNLLIFISPRYNSRPNRN